MRKVEVRESGNMNFTSQTNKETTVIEDRQPKRPKNWKLTPLLSKRVVPLSVIITFDHVFLTQKKKMKNETDTPKLHPPNHFKHRVRGRVFSDFSTDPSLPSPRASKKRELAVAHGTWLSHCANRIATHKPPTKGDTGGAIRGDTNFKKKRGGGESNVQGKKSTMKKRCIYIYIHD